MTFVDTTLSQNMGGSAKRARWAKQAAIAILSLWGVSCAGLSTSAVVDPRMGVDALPREIDDLEVHHLFPRDNNYITVISSSRPFCGVSGQVLVSDSVVLPGNADFEAKCASVCYFDHRGYSCELFIDVDETTSGAEEGQ